MKYVVQSMSISPNKRYGTTESGEDYWLARNSWGTGWGESGYMKMKREADTQCGTGKWKDTCKKSGNFNKQIGFLDPLPLFGTGCVDDNVPVQTVCGQCGILYDTSYPIGVEAADVWP